MIDNRDIAILDKETISTREIILYLMAINVSNSQIIQVLQKKPSLPDFDKLSWFQECQKDFSIVEKLKTEQKLNKKELIHLKGVLSKVLFSLNKSHRNNKGRKKTGLENYIKNLDLFLG